VFENDFSSTAPVFSIMEAGGIAAGTSVTTGYAGRFTAQSWVGKRTADAFDRIKIDALNGRLYMGPGNAAATAFLSATTVATLLNGGGHLYAGTDAVGDIGASASNRFRNAYLSGLVKAGSAVITGSGATGSRPNAVTLGAGAMFYDTTLSKPIWSDGTVWRDATGTTV
jgi:hypothetical protein